MASRSARHWEIDPRRDEKPAEQAERDHRQAQQHRHLRAAEDQRPGLPHDVEVEELEEEDLHHALFQAKRRSIHEPSATTGTKMTT